MAYEIPGLLITGTAGSDLSSAQYRFVKMSTDGKVDTVGLGGAADGVLQNAPSSDQAAQIMINGVSKVVSDGTVGPGEWVASSTIGKGQASTAGSYRLGRVWSGSTSSTGIISVLLNIPGHTT